MDVEQVMPHVREAVERARSGAGPSLLECKAYRYQGHFTAERALKLTYRLQDEIDLWREQDPVTRWAEKLEQRTILSPEERAAVDESVEELAGRGRGLRPSQRMAHRGRGLSQTCM